MCTDAFLTSFGCWATERIVFSTSATTLTRHNNVTKTEREKPGLRSPLGLSAWRQPLEQAFLHASIDGLFADCRTVMDGVVEPTDTPRNNVPAVRVVSTTRSRDSARYDKWLGCEEVHDWCHRVVTIDLSKICLRSPATDIVVATRKDLAATGRQNLEPSTSCWLYCILKTHSWWRYC